EDVAQRRQWDAGQHELTRDAAAAVDEIEDVVDDERVRGVAALRARPWAAAGGEHDEARALRHHAAPGVRPTTRPERGQRGGRSGDEATAREHGPHPIIGLARTTEGLSRRSPRPPGAARPPAAARASWRRAPSRPPARRRRRRP